MRVLGREEVRMAETKSKRVIRVDPAKKLLQENLRAIRRTVGEQLMPMLKTRLEVLTREFLFSLPAGELQILDGGWYVTHTGLLALARRKRCRGIHVEAVDVAVRFRSQPLCAEGHGLPLERVG